MNKKGFTLVELLGVLLLLSIIIVIIFPAVNDILNTGKDTIANIQTKEILDAAYDYTLKNTRLLPEENETYFLTLNELKKHGFIDSDIENTENEEYPNNLVISVKNVGNNYKYNNESSKLNGSYLYTVEYELMETQEFIDNKPTISLEGDYAESLVYNVNVGTSYIEPLYEATSISGEDLTDKVVSNITLDSKNISNINTTKADIYHINYTVIDENGYSSELVLKVVIIDTEIPVLTVPENETIDTTVTSLDLMEGASCTDNSGICDINVTGEIKYGETGKYIIEYSAVDPTGNTALEKRVITIE